MQFTVSWNNPEVTQGISDLRFGEDYTKAREGRTLICCLEGRLNWCQSSFSPPPTVAASQSGAASRHRWGVSRCRYSYRGARTGPVRDLVAHRILAQLQCQTIRLERCCIICPSVLLRPWPQRNLALRVQRFDNGYDYQFSFCPKKFLYLGSHWSAFKMMVENLHRASQTSHVSAHHRTTFGKEMTGFVCWLRLVAFA